MGKMRKKVVPTVWIANDDRLSASGCPEIPTGRKTKRGPDSKRKEAKSEALEPDIRDDDDAGLDGPSFQALEELCRSTAKGVEWLLDGENCFARPLREPCAMFWLTEEGQVTATIDLARLVEGGLDTSSGACHEHDDTRHWAI
jgi:hypothetical protein